MNKLMILYLLPHAVLYKVLSNITFETLIYVHADVGSEPSENGEKDEHIVPALRPSDTEVQRQFYDYMVCMLILIVSISILSDNLS